MATALRSKRGFDWILFVVFLCLVFTGLVMVYATTYNDFSIGWIVVPDFETFEIGDAEGFGEGLHIDLGEIHS